MSGTRSQQDQPSSHTCTRGSIQAVRRIPDEAVVVPCSATLVSVSEDIVSEEVDECCEESEIGVDMSAVPSLSAGLEIVSEQLASEDMDACEESDIVVDIPAVVPCVEPVSISDDTTTNMDVCQKSESDGGLPVVAYFDPLQTALGKAVFSEPTIFPMDKKNLKLLCYCPRLGSRNSSLKFASDQRVVRTQEFGRAECRMKYCVMLRN